MSTVKDLVCGMRVDPQTTPHHVLHGEHKHYFCSAECAAKFAADPEKYGHPLTPIQSERAISHDEAPTTVKDPICGMSVAPGAQRHHLQHEGKYYYFCSDSCAAKFKADPQKYVGTGALAHSGENVTRQEDTQTLYTCPMHPEVRQTGPGTCPKCGMALEPEAVTLAEGDTLELKDMARRF